MRKPRHILHYGASALLLEWEQRIDRDINASVHAYRAFIAKRTGVLDCVPAYASLLVYTDLDRIELDGLREQLYDIRLTQGADHSPTLHRLPVCFDGDFGLDLPTACEHAGMKAEELIRLFLSTDYHVYQIGFTPGFAFLGLTNQRLEVPRRPQPRTTVPPGSLGLAGRQTAIYPTVCPGGWQLIGRCPLNMLITPPGRTDYRPRLMAGDGVRFERIDRSDYHRLKNTPDTWKSQ